jgi:hypothetical protein
MVNHPNAMTLIVLGPRADVTLDHNELIKNTSSFVTLQNTAHVIIVYIDSIL